MLEQIEIADIAPAPRANARRKRASRITRGDHYGINATALSRNVARKLANIRLKLAKLAEPWGDADPLVEDALAHALTAIDALAKQFADSAEYLNEPMID